MGKVIDMTVKYRFLCLILTCLLLLCHLSACGNAKSDDPGPQIDSENLNSLSDYDLVFPSGASETLKSAVTTLWQEVRNQFGVTWEIRDDFEQAEENAREILIGFTTREYSQQVMKGIGYFDWSICWCKDQLVIASHTEKALLSALDCFANDLLTLRDGCLTLAEERTYHSDTYEFFFSENPITKYRIVYPKGNAVLKQSAERVAQLLKRNFSADLPVVSDEQPEQAGEILLGVTNRKKYAAYYTGVEAPDALHTLISAEEDHILIVGTTDRAARLACERFIETFFKVGYSYQFNLPDGYHVYEVAHLSDADRALTEGATLRVMSYNILDSVELSPDKAPFEDRKDYIEAEILYYMPDVVGLQEVHESAYAELEKTLGKMYAFTNKKTPNGEYSYTTLMYNTETLRYITGASELYSVGNRRIRLMVWGLFESKKTGDRFLAFSTHWEVRGQDRRMIQAEEMTARVNELCKTYNCPVVTTGDFNTQESATYFQSYLTNTSQREARYSAERIAYALPTDVIDHITHSEEGLSALTFKLIKNSETAIASDHDPIWADFRFAK